MNRENFGVFVAGAIVMVVGYCFGRLIEYVVTHLHLTWEWHW